MLNLDVLAAEAGATPKDMTLGGTVFTLPAELPGQALAPFLRPDLGLVDVIADVIASSDEEANLSAMLFGVLEKKPNLPNGLLLAAADSLKAILGDQYDAFLAKQPSVNTYFRLGRGLLEEYSVGLTDFFDSSPSSGDEVPNSSETSPSTTPATPEATSEVSSAPPVIPASSEPVASGS